jgi:hypothetical protein
MISPMLGRGDKMISLSREGGNKAYTPKMIVLFASILRSHKTIY